MHLCKNLKTGENVYMYSTIHEMVPCYKIMIYVSSPLQFVVNCFYCFHLEPLIPRIGDGRRLIEKHLRNRLFKQ